MSPYFWRATYKEGTHVTSDNVPYAEIDRRRLRRFEVVQRETGKALIDMPFEPADCLIWRKRVQIRPTGEERYHIVCRERVVGQYFILYLNEATGEVKGTMRFDPSNALLCEPERLPFEI